MSPIKWTASVVCLALVGCSSDPATFITYANQRGTTNAALDVTKSPPLTDALALNYANSVECIFRARATGARYTREASDTALAGLAAATAAAGTFSYGASTVVALGISSGGIVQLRNIFNARARANAYADAAARMHAAIKDYVAYNLNGVSETALTPNGWTLVNVVQANIDMVDKVLNGHLPTEQDLVQATEAMRPEGARSQPPGTKPVNNISRNASVPLPTLRQPIPLGPGPKPRAQIDTSVLTLQAECQDGVDRVTGTLPDATLKVMDRLDPPVMKDGATATKFSRDKHGLRTLIHRTTNPSDLNDIKQSLSVASGLGQGEKLQPTISSDVLDLQNECQDGVDRVTGPLPDATLKVMDRLDPPVTKDGTTATKFSRDKHGLRTLIHRTTNPLDLNDIKQSLPPA
jgi:hypothetical protein